jgi:hypothetical protein
MLIVLLMIAVSSSKSDFKKAVIVCTFPSKLRLKICNT